jgi:hypothetical protein
VITWAVPQRRVDRIQALDGVFLCVRRSVADALGFDERTFNGYPLYDLDFTFRAHLAGYRQSVACDLYPLHNSTGKNDSAWQTQAHLFMQKFAGKLAPPRGWSCQNPAIWVRTAEEVVAAMTPSHWDDSVGQPICD